MANVSVPVPGVVKHEYIDAPLAPQVSVITVKYLIEDALLFNFWISERASIQYFQKGDM